MSAVHLPSVLVEPERMLRLSLAEWESLIRQARKTLLLARLAEQCAERGWADRIPPRPLRHLEAARRFSQWRRREVRWEVDCIRRSLEAIDTPVALLKGAAYEVADLPPAKGRVFNDVDILVPRDKLQEVETALRMHGWVSYVNDAHDQRFYREWMHELPPMQHVTRQTEIDVHHTITPPVSRYPVEGTKLLRAARPLDIPGRFLVLAPPDMVLHSVAHLFQEGEFDNGLRDVMDVDDLLRHFGKESGFWQALLERAEELGLGRLLYYGVAQIGRLLGTEMPADFRTALDRFAPWRPVREVMLSLFSAALAADLASGRRGFTGTARELLYLRGHYLRMPVRLMVPHLVRKAWRRNFAT
jgi:hypothetical protein